MHQPSSLPYHYGASTNPNALPTNNLQAKNLPQFNPVEVKQNMVNGEQHMDNINLSYNNKSTSDPQNPPSNTNVVSSISSDNKYASTFTNQPFNGGYQQNSAFTSVTSSSNYSQSSQVTPTSSVETSSANNAIQPSVGTESTLTTQATPVTNMSNQNINQQPQTTSFSSVGKPYLTTNGNQTLSENLKTQPVASVGNFVQPVQQTSGMLNKAYQAPMSTYQQNPPSRANIQEVSSADKSSFQLTSPYNAQSSMSSAYSQQNLATSNPSMQPLVSNKQGPNSYGSASNVMQVPLIASNPSQPSFPSGAAPPISGLQPQVPVSNSSLQTPLGSSNMMRPPLVTNRFQAPGATINSLSTPVPQQFQRPQQQNANHSQQTFRMPPNTYSQSSKTAPFNNGLTPLTNASLYQQQQQQPIPNIPPLPNSQQNSSNFQPSNNLYNNIQVPPRAQPGNYPSVPAGYPSLNQAGYQQQQQQQTLNSQFSNLSVNQGMNKMWGYEPHDLLNTRDILPATKVEPPPIRLPQNLPESMNCSRDLFRCTLTKIPETKSLLDKSRLPLGLLIHPFKDINNLKVIKNTIVRCRQCRTYINPFVQFLDSKQWKCNICFRTNEVHEQFLYDRNTEMFGDPYRRPEIQSATVEYLATADYTVRDPPQPAMYLFLLDVSQIAAQSGYLYTVCEVLLNQLKSMPGDRRTSIAIITYDSAVHFYSLAEGQTQPSQMILTDIDDIFLPSPENILVNLSECYDMIVDLLKQLPGKFKDSLDSGSALGPALQAAFKLLQPTGGRITIFQTCLPNRGPGALQSRENPNQRSNDDPPHMNPATDFYKKIALECTSFYIAVDLFILNSQYVDLATLSGVSKFSSGCIHHIPLYSGKNMSHVYQLDRMFSRYLTRKIGFESVMRIRCTKGMSIHTFHGNFFVRSTDLLALPNVNPDAGYGIQISIDENLTHIQYACFQVAVLYTSSKGDRRIRVHTLCLPVVSNINDVLVGADQACIAGLLAKMAVDRSLQHSLSDAREAFLNVVCDVLSTYKMTQAGHLTGSLLAPSSLKLLPLYVLALLKHPAFRIGQSTRLDDRLFAMTEMKCLPLNSLMLSIYPELYPIHTLDQDPTIEWNELQVPIPRILQLSAERLQATGTYLLNMPDLIIILVRHGTSPAICSGLFGFQSVAQMPETLFELPQLETQLSLKLNSFISYLNDDKAYVSPVKVIKDSSPDRMEFYDKLIEDKNAGGMAYYEFLLRIREQV